MKGFIVDHFKNWYDYLFRFELDLFESFILENENLIQKGIKNFEENVETEIIEFDDIHYSITDYYQNIDSSTYDLEEIFKEYFPNLKRQSLLLMLCALTEKELYNLCFQIQKKMQTKFSIEDLNSSRGKLHKIREYYNNTILINNKGRIDLYWDALTKLYQIRNQITHNFGKISNRRLEAYIEELEYISINESKEILLEKEFLNSSVNLIRNIGICIQNSIREEFDEKHKLN